MSKNKKSFESIECKICNKEFDGIRSLASHLQMEHQIKSKDYAIDYLYDGEEPRCQYSSCDNEVRYVRFSFKRFCKDHAREAMKIGGVKGGKSEAWNKGKTKFDDSRLMKQSIAARGEGNHFYGKNHSQETIDKLRKIKRISKDEFNNRMQLRKNDFEVLTTYDEYFSRQHQYLRLICKTCGLNQSKTLQAFERGSLCHQCYPSSTSIDQVEILKFVRELGYEDVESSTRTVIAPYELDLYIPSKNFAIEYNSLYYHREEGKSQTLKSYHKNKTILCNKKGIKLFHIFGDEWRDKKDIVKSMIMNRLDRCEFKIGARQCEVVYLGDKQGKKKVKIFLEESHISGYGRSQVCFGLVYKSELVSVITLRVPVLRNKYNDSIEIGRFASKKGHLIMGGFSKLLKTCITWAKENGFSRIVTYADLRFGEGKVYLKNGFEFVKETEINYWYTDDVHRHDRFKFRAQNGKSEKEIAEENNVHKIYGCGNYLYEKKL